VKAYAFTVKACAIIAALLLAMIAPLAAADAKPAAALPAASAAPASAALPALGLAEARSRAAAAGPKLPAELDALVPALPASEALDLLREFIPALASPGDRARNAMRFGDLALLLGRYADAAAGYETALAALPAESRGGELQLRAARARLAAGDADRATDLASLALMSAADAAQSARARLIGAWALALRDRKAEARTVAEEIAGNAALGSDIRREARFLLWAAALPAARAEAASALAAAFPGSAEALVAQGGLALPPAPHWYLGAISLAGAPAASAANPPDAAPALSKPTEARGLRFQVGYYAKEENATATRDLLKAKGFAAVIESRPQVAAKAGDDGRRWAVVVDGGADPAATQDRLKDSGYESYPLF